MSKRRMTMAEAQAQCTAWRIEGRRTRDPKLMKKAAKLEAKFRNHPDYENDQAFIMRMQSGRHLGWLAGKP